VQEISEKYGCCSNTAKMAVLQKKTSSNASLPDVFRRGEKSFVFFVIGNNTIAALAGR